MLPGAGSNRSLLDSRNRNPVVAKPPTCHHIVISTIRPHGPGPLSRDVLHASSKAPLANFFLDPRSRPFLPLVWILVNGGGGIEKAQAATH